MSNELPVVNDLGDDEARRILVAVIKAAFPHAAVPDGPYERAAEKVEQAADGAAWTRIKLRQGLDSLQARTGGDFAALDRDEAFRLLQQVEDTDWFSLIRSTVIVTLYEDEDVWEVLGYEGPSFDKGGYIDRGFDDLDWLPDPRVEEYDGPEQWRDIIPYGPTDGADAASGGAGATAGAPGSATISPAAPAGQTRAQVVRTRKA